MKRILVIAAHPDDETLGCGGTISRLIEMDSIIRILIVAEGSSCRFNDINSTGSNDAISLRNQCCIEAVNSLGVADLHFLNLTCGRLDQYPIIEINKLIETHISAFQPDTIFTHSPTDANNDHRIVFRSTSMATRPFNSPVKMVLCYEVLSSTEWGFENSFSPNFFMKLSSHHVLNKQKALMNYLTEIKSFPYPRSSEGVELQCKIRGMQAGVSYAEAFSLYRCIQ